MRNDKLLLLSISLWCSASAAYCQEATSQASISIRVSVTPRFWKDEAGFLCATLPKEKYRLRYAGSWISPASDVSCKAKGSAHRIKPGRGRLILIVPE